MLMGSKIDDAGHQKEQANRLRELLLEISEIDDPTLRSERLADIATGFPDLFDHLQRLLDSSQKSPEFS